MIAAGVFDERDGRHLELIHGEIREMTPPGPEHEEILELLTEWSYSILPSGAVRIRIQDSIGLPPLESAPEPDVVWAVRKSYRRVRPSAKRILLIIEVSDSSLNYDRHEKADLYAAAGIADYWIVNIPEQNVEVRRQPTDAKYRLLEVFSGGQEVRPLAFPQIALRPAILWAER